MSQFSLHFLESDNRESNTIIFRLAMVVVVALYANEHLLIPAIRIGLYSDSVSAAEPVDEAAEQKRRVQQLAREKMEREAEKERLRVQVHAPNPRSTNRRSFINTIIF
jgi:hypothetical protein